jgi:ribosomal protein L11 methyltransferase
LVNAMPATAINNNWWEIQILANQALDELLFWRLQSFGCEGTASAIAGDQVLIKAYLPIEKSSLLDLSALALWATQDAIAIEAEAPIVTWRVISEEDWSSSWKQYWQPQKIGDAFIICPSWIELEDPGDRQIIHLDPGTAFGTGAHATTQLCLEALEMRLMGLKPDSNTTFADVGCGSGILGIGAILLGVSKVYAVDTDPLAVQATKFNFQRNNIDSDRLWVDQGSLGHLLKNLPEPVDGFACNILAEIIVDMIPYMHQLIKPSGWGILSGILLDQVPTIAEVLDEHEWVIATLWKRQEWSCLTIRRST